MIHLPSILPISDLDLVRLLTNITDNAVEAACCRVTVSERVIEMNSRCIEGRISIEITNTYDRLAAYNGEELPISKPDKHFHGHGLNIVKQIVGNNGGVQLIEVNQEEMIFLLRLHIPQHMLDSTYLILAKFRNSWRMSRNRCYCKHTSAHRPIYKIMLSFPKRPVAL